jgi:hypothetical protein
MIGPDPQNQKYNSLGIAIDKPMTGSPVGNEDIVWNSTKRPNNPGALLPGQAISDLTFQSGYSQRRIRITMNPGDNPVQSAGSIAIINEAGDIIWSTGDNTNISIEFIQAQTDITSLKIIPQVETTADTVDIEIVFPGSTADGINILNSGSGDGIDIETTTGRGINIRTTDGGWPIVTNDLDPAIAPFDRVLLTAGGTGPVVITSDGTDPNGVISAPIGSICLNASPTGQLAYNSDGVDTWITL